MNRPIACSSGIDAGGWAQRTVPILPVGRVDRADRLLGWGTIPIGALLAEARAAVP